MPAGMDIKLVRHIGSERPATHSRLIRGWWNDDDLHVVLVDDRLKETLTVVSPNRSLVRVEQLEIRLDALQQVVCTALKPSHCPGIDLMIINFGVSAAWVWIGCVIPIIARTPNDVLFFAELTATAERIDEEQKFLDLRRDG